MYLFIAAWTGRPFPAKEHPAVPEADTADVGASEIGDQFPGLVVQPVHRYLKKKKRKKKNRKKNTGHMITIHVAALPSRLEDIYFVPGSSKEAMRTKAPLSMFFRKSMNGATAATDTHKSLTSATWLPSSAKCRRRWDLLPSYMLK